MVDGHWEGFYEMEGHSEELCNEWGMQKFRVEAWLESDGDIVTGRMVDQDCHFEMLYSEYFEKLKENFAWIDARTAEVFIKDYPKAVMIISGFDESIFEGAIKDAEFHFTKRYAGKHKTIYRYNNTEETHATESGLIYYYGSLEDEGLSIKGTYKTMGNRDFLPITGYFELHMILEKRI